MSRRTLTWLFLAPTLIGLGLFTFLPIIASVLLAFFEWDIITPPRFVGFGNFASVVTSPTIRVSFANTIGFVVVAVTLQLAVALLLAVLVSTKMPQLLRSFFRSVLFFPLILSAASVSIIMSYLFNENFGVVNQLLGLVGIGNVPWLTSSRGAMVVVVLVYVWQNFGFSFLLFLGGLASIPNEVYEASQVDGASSWQQFWRITLPLLRPTLFMVTLLATIGAMKEFALIQSLNGGGPGSQNVLMVQYIYQTGFEYARIGYASAASMVLMVILMVIALLQMRLDRGDLA